MSEDRTEQRRREARPHVIPPAPGWRVDAQGPPEGWHVLSEVDGALGITLWQALRAVWTWVDTPESRRNGLSQEPTREVQERLACACADAPELVRALDTFALLARAADLVGGDQIADACDTVYAWAATQSFPETAIHFAEAGARVTEDPGLASFAGRICRQAARNERAAVWYSRAFHLAVRAHDHTETIRALLGYGALLKDLGKHREARKFFQRAASRAERTGRKRQAAEAYHDLLTIAAESGTYLEALAYFRNALRLYPATHPYFPALAHDWAWLLVRLRHYSAAIPFLEIASTHTPRPAIETVVSATLARAVAGAGQQSRFQEIEDRVLKLTELYDEFTPAAFIHLAEAARTFCDWTKAERYATAALNAATRRGESLIESDARALLKKVSAHELTPGEEPVPEPERIEALTRRFAVRLQRWKVPAAL